MLDLYNKCIYDYQMKKKAGRPKKSGEALRSQPLIVRLQSPEKEAFQDAANLAGVALSSWVRERLRRAAVRELEAASQPIAFLKEFRLD